MSKSADTKTTQSPPTDNDQCFYDNLVECLTSVSQRFPENTAVKSNLQMLKQFSNLKSTCRSQWREFTKDHIADVMCCNAKRVCDVFMASGQPMMTDIKIQDILLNPSVEFQTKDSIWKFLQVLTVLAHNGTETQITKKEIEIYKKASEAARVSAVNDTVRAVTKEEAIAVARENEAAAAAAAVTAPSGTSTNTTTKPKPPDMKQAMETMIESMPKFVKQFNAIMNDKDGDNMFAQMARQFANPGALQPGLEPNLAATAMAQSAPEESVMQEVQQQMVAQGMVNAGTPSLSADEIMKKLKRLEQIESARAKRKKAAAKSGR